MSPSIVARSFLFASLAFAQATHMDFADPHHMDSWQFSRGGEFPGAAGSLQWNAGDSLHTGTAVLQMDLRGGGKYVAAIHRLETPTPLAALSATIRQTAGVSLLYRIVDSTGQTLVFPSARTPGLPADEWFQDWIRLDQPCSGHWGGADDGILHGPVQSVALVLDPYPFVDRTATLVISSLDLYAQVPTAILQPPFQGSLVRIRHPLSSTAGIAIHFTNNPALLDSVAAAGFRHIRTDIYWNSAERTPGQFDFTPWDTLTAQAKRRNLDVHFILAYNNPLYSNDPDISVPPLTGKNREAFARFCQKAAEHFRGRVALWEIWNEADYARFWKPKPDPQAYAQLFGEAYQAIRTVDATTPVVISGILAHNQSWLSQVAASPLSNGSAGYALHPYRPQPPEWAVRDLLGSVSRDSRKGRTDSLFITEWGYSSTEHPQAGLLTSRILTTCMLSGTSTCTLYDIIDDGPNPQNREHNFGLLRPDRSPKDGWVAVRNVLRRLGNADSVTILSTGHPGLMALQIPGPADRITIVAWSLTGPLNLTVPLLPLSITDPLGKPVHLKNKNQPLQLQISEGIWTFEFAIP